MAVLDLIVVGSRWNRVTCLSKTVLELTTNVGDGVEVVEKVPHLKMVCDCGQEFTVSSRDWRGKRRLKDCGRCGLGLFKDAKVGMMVTMDQSLLVALQQMADEKETSLSQLARDAVREYMEARGWKQGDGWRVIVPPKELVEKVRLDNQPQPKPVAVPKAVPGGPAKNKSKIW